MKFQSKDKIKTVLTSTTDVCPVKIVIASITRSCRWVALTSHRQIVWIREIGIKTKFKGKPSHPCKDTNIDFTNVKR